MKTKFLNSLVLLFMFTAVTFAQTKFASDDTDTRNQATFESNAPLEDIVGVSDKLISNITLDLNDITKNPQGTVKVELGALKTGIDLRDHHLRSANWLDTENYPYAEFVLSGISDASSKALEDGKKVTAKASGKISIHGVTKDIIADVELTYIKETEKTKKEIPGNLLRITTNFKLKLTDFNISIPSMVAGKVDETIKVSANFIASDANKAM